MRYVRSILAKARAWLGRIGWHRGSAISHVAFGQMIYRDVTPTGVRVYSLCGGCGARLECSATLCEECATDRTRPRPASAD